MNENIDTSNKKPKISEQRLKETIDTAFNLVEVDIMAMKMRYAEQKYGRTPSQSLSVKTNSQYFKKFFNQVESLLTPFKTYNHWAAYGFTTKKRSQNQTQLLEFTITREQLQLLIKTNQTSETLVAYFKRQEVRKNKIRLEPDDADQTLKRIISEIKESESNDRVPFYEEKIT